MFIRDGSGAISPCTPSISGCRTLSRNRPASRPAGTGAGLTDMTPDGLPIIDDSAGPQGLTIITGLSGHGFHYRPCPREIASDLSQDGHTKHVDKEFRLSRFTDSPIHRPEMMI
jgi:glycine/D-amino acid oxidase-like deaminating enzyme